MNTMVKILKQIGLLSIILAGLTLLGNTINAIIPWDSLTILFAIARNKLEIVDFWWNVDSAFVWIGLSLLIWLAVWAYKAYLLIVGKLHH